MQKKSKKVFAAVLAALMVLSVGYFALLAPTSAWFNQQEAITHTFKFGDFDVEEEITETVSETIRLRAATRFADKGEDLFDEVAYVEEVQLVNYGEMDAQVRVAVKDNDSDAYLDVESSALKWFITDTLPEESTTGEYVRAGKGVYKTAIESMLVDSGVVLEKYGALPAATAETDYENYNEAEAIPALSAHNNAGIELSNSSDPDNSSKTLYIVFWAEYGAVKNAFAATADVTQEFDVCIECTATPAAKYDRTPTTSAT